MAISRSAEKEEFWRFVLHEQRNSGLTIKAFCKQQELSEPSFYAWRREIQKRDRGQAGDTDQQRLVNVKVVDPANATSLSASNLEITSPSGFLFNVASDVAPERVARLAWAIENVFDKGRSSC